MGKQIHKRLADEQVRGLLERYCSKEIELEYVLKSLEIKRRQFFKLLKRYRKEPGDFSIAYNRQKVSVPTIIDRAKKTLFRLFVTPPPFESTKDMFCLRVERMINSYRKVSLNNLELKVSGVPLHSKVQMRIVPDKDTGIAEVRFWYKDKLVDIQKVKNTDLNLVHF